MGRPTAALAWSQPGGELDSSPSRQVWKWAVVPSSVWEGLFRLIYPNSHSLPLPPQVFRVNRIQGATFPPHVRYVSRLTRNNQVLFLETLSSRGAGMYTPRSKLQKCSQIS